MTNITDAALADLRRQVVAMLSERRAGHVLRVENAAVRIAELCGAENIAYIRAAALLHDITKELPLKKHLQILQECGIMVSSEYSDSPHLLHAVTAAAIIPRDFPVFAKCDVVGAVRWHTTGTADMTLIEKIVFLADYIEDGREYSECIRMRGLFYDANPENMTQDEALAHLDSCVLATLNSTIMTLKRLELPICSESIRARDYLENILNPYNNERN